MKKLITLLLIPFLISGCKNKEQTPEVVSFADYGAFLGRSGNDISNFKGYKYLSLELDEFTHTNIQRIIDRGQNIFAYLNIGSLENYREYYDEYESFTFKDYDNWPDERWIDVRNSSWQDLMVNTATRFKSEGVFGVYLDNVDVYTIAKEEGLNYSEFGSAIKAMISRINETGLKVMINGGAEYLDDMADQDDNVFESIWAYHQEEVFSLITDYDLRTFGEQEKEDQEYYQEISKMMKDKGKEVFFLEYTTDNSLKDTIKSYCDSKEYHYYISSTVDLR